MSQFHFAVTFVDQSNPKELVYKIDFKTTLAQYKNSAHSNLARSDSDFQWLHKELKRSNLDCVIPPLPSIDVANFAALSESAVAEKLQEALLVFLKRLGSHPILSQSPILQHFLETGHQFAPYAMSKVKSQGFLSKMAKSVKTTREIDPWFEHQKSDVQSLNNVMAIALRCLEKVCKAQKSLATSMTEAANKYADFGNEEPNIQLASNLKKFATILEKSGNTFKFMADTEAIQLGEFLNNQLNYCHAIDYTMDSRANALQSYEEACKSTLKRKQASDKLKVASVLRHDKVDASLSELTDARNAESEAKELVKKISDAIRERELPLITKQRNVDFCEALRLYARAQCEMELRQKKDWESIVADLQKVDTHLVQHRQLAEKIEAQVL